MDVSEYVDLRMSEAEATRTYRTSAKTVLCLKGRLMIEGLWSVLERKRKLSPDNLKIDGDVEAVFRQVRRPRWWSK